jgi:alkylated DNA repair dioxygenase AlkB
MTNNLRDSGGVWVEPGFWPDAEGLFARLRESIAWDDRMRARRVASFGVPYHYSGVVHDEVPFPADLLPVLDAVAGRLGYRPNNCLAHLYPDGTSTMGFHADATDRLAPGTGIAVLSLGAERAITFRAVADRAVTESLPLPSGSLLFLSAAIQATWMHAILPDAAAGGRISLAFRRMRGA